MAKRRSNAEIEEIRKINVRTSHVADAINDRIGLDDVPVSISAANYWANKADFQREVADTLVVKFTTKDPMLAEKMVAAMKAVWEQDQALKQDIAQELRSPGGWAYRDQYRLPDGTVVQTDATATKGAAVIDYTLANGTIVQATRVI